jgi:hypothetical protein
LLIIRVVKIQSKKCLPGFIKSQPKLLLELKLVGKPAAAKSHTSLTVSPTVSPCLPHRLSHCVSHCVSVSPSSSLSLCLPLCLRVSLIVSLTVSPTVSPCLPHRLSHCVLPLCLRVSLIVSPTGRRPGRCAPTTSRRRRCPSWSTTPSPASRSASRRASCAAPWASRARRTSPCRRRRRRERGRPCRGHSWRHRYASVTRVLQRPARDQPGRLGTRKGERQAMR